MLSFDDKLYEPRYQTSLIRNVTSNEIYEQDLNGEATKLCFLIGV